MLNKRPRFLIFQFFFQPPDLVRTLPFINFKETDFFTNPFFHFLSLLVLFTPNIQDKVECFCIYFSSMLCDNLFLFFPSFYNHLKPFLKFRSPFILTLPRLLNFRIFSDPLFIRTPHLFGTWEYSIKVRSFCTYKQFRNYSICVHTQSYTHKLQKKLQLTKWRRKLEYGKVVPSWKKAMLMQKDESVGKTYVHV